MFVVFGTVLYVMRPKPTQVCRADDDDDGDDDDVYIMLLM